MLLLAGVLFHCSPGFSAEEDLRRQLENEPTIEGIHQILVQSFGLSEGTWDRPTTSRRLNRFMREEDPAYLYSQLPYLTLFILLARSSFSTQEQLFAKVAHYIPRMEEESVRYLVSVFLQALIARVLLTHNLYGKENREVISTIEYPRPKPSATSLILSIGLLPAFERQIARRAYYRVRNFLEEADLLFEWDEGQPRVVVSYLMHLNVPIAHTLWNLDDSLRKNLCQDFLGQSSPEGNWLIQ